MKTNTLSGLPEGLVMQIMFFLSIPTLMQLLSRSFYNQSQQSVYWQSLICERFSTFATFNQLAEDKAPTLKNIYYILSLFTKPSTPQALVQTELNTFLAKYSQQDDIDRFPWVYYIQGCILLENDSDQKRAYFLFESAVNNKFPGSSARRMMAIAYRHTIEDPDQQYQLLLKSAFGVEKHFETAWELGNFFEFKLENTNDENLKDSFRQSAIKWHEEAFDLGLVKVEEIKNRDLEEIKLQNLHSIMKLHVPGSQELFNFLSKHGLYYTIFINYEDFTKNKVITVSKEELHASWLNEMRETKDVTSKQLYAKELSKLHQVYSGYQSTGVYSGGPTFRFLDWLTDSQIKILEEECCVILLGRRTIEEDPAEPYKKFNKNRVFRQQSGPPKPQTPSENKCLIM